MCCSRVVCPVVQITREGKTERRKTENGRRVRPNVYRSPRGGGTRRRGVSGRRRRQIVRRARRSEAKKNKGPR